MEIMDGIKGILKSTGTQIKSRIMGGEQAVTVAEIVPSKKECSEEKVAANPDSRAQVSVRTLDLVEFG